MKICLINGSPKRNGSASAAILNDLKVYLPGQDLSEIHFRSPQVSDEQLPGLFCAEVWVFAFPLYVDTVPSHVLYCLWQLEPLVRARSWTGSVYAVSNNGFYEGKQNRPALEVMENWAERCRVTWGGGIGLGAGGMMESVKKVHPGKGPKKNVGKAFEQFSMRITDGIPGENMYIQPNFPRFLYQIMAEMNWRRLAKKNGLSVKDLFAKL